MVDAPATVPDETQPPITLHHVSYTRGELEGKFCVVVYNAHTDKTSVIAPESQGYKEAMAALMILEVSARQRAKAEKKTVLHKATVPKLILPGSHARN